MDAARRAAIHAAMVRLADGDRTAFDVLLDELWPVILSYARSAVGHSADADDVAQDVFLNICARIADFDRSRDALSWAFGIAGYQVMTLRRRIRRRREVHDEEAIASLSNAGQSQEELVMVQEVARAFEQAIGALSPEDRCALGLVEGVKPAPATGATLRKRKQRALDRLRVLWKSLYGEL